MQPLTGHLAIAVSATNLTWTGWCSSLAQSDGAELGIQHCPPSSSVVGVAGNKLTDSSLSPLDLQILLTLGRYLSQATVIVTLKFSLSD